jgi:murein DD-endopeptidase MepM/ murein hydrolase activator NlpD
VAWPTYPITQILTVFKDPAFEREYWFKNFSVKLSVEQGTPVYAMRDWVVYYVNNWVWNLNWLLILHTDGYVSTYAYLSTIYVEQWDYVKRGQVIAKSWWEAWTQW